MHSVENLSKGHQRKLNALVRSVGQELGEETFEKWRSRSQADRRLADAARVDPAIEKLRQCLPADPPLNLGLHGMKITRNRRRSNGQGDPHT